MSIWKDLFGGKSPEREYRERMKKEAEEKQKREGKEGIRDHFIQSKSFFDQQIEKTENYISEIKEEYKVKIKESPDFDFSGYFDDFNIEFLHLINAQYSRGDNVVDIVPNANALMETASKFWLPDSEEDYSNGGDMNFNRLYDSIALGILAKAELSYFEELAQVMKEKNFHDYLADWLIHSQLPNHAIADELLVKDSKSLNSLVEIIKANNTTEAEEKAKIYLQKEYYSPENLAYYYDSHNFENGRNYYGYWAWVVSAIVKIKKLNTTSFKSSDYYPFDFVHWNQEPPKKNTLLAE